MSAMVAQNPMDFIGGFRGTVDEFKNLAGDLEVSWSDPQSDERTKKRLLRVLIDDILVDIDEKT